MLARLSSTRVLVAAVGVLAAALVALGVHHFTSDHGDDFGIAFEPAELPEAAEPSIAEATVADVGFLQDMTDHHSQAVLMASHVVRHGDNEQVRNMALNIMSEQAFELGVMAGHLNDRGQSRGAPDRETMAWMGHGVPLHEMPGIQAQADINELLGLEGSALDRRFLEMMLDHHLGGVEMAEWGVTLVSDPAIRDLAAGMVVAQQAEITDIQTMLGVG